MRSIAVLALSLLSQAATLPAMASLGADATSVEADRVQMRGTLHVTTTASYEIHEIQLPSGTLLREYVSAAGKVFAVSWRGPAMPDLRQALGPYFDKLQAAPGTRSGHHHMTVEQPDIVMHSSRHLRAFVGHAYVPALLPAGVAASEIR